MADDLIKISRLKTYFEMRDRTVRAVDGLDLEIRPGQIVGLVGESGSGKTVAGLSILGLVDRPGRIVSGNIWFKGEDLARASSRRMEELRGNRISMIFQDPMMTLNPVLRIDTQMMEAITIHNPGVSRKAARERALHALEEVGIAAPAERLRCYPHELSGGMRQRVVIAIALLNQPDLIIADEPTTALDVSIQAQILYAVRNAARRHGTGLIWITHDLGVAAEIADRIAVMYAGRIVEEGPTDEVLDRPRHPYTSGLIKSLPDAQTPGARLFQISGMAPSLINPPEGCAFRPRCPNVAESCYVMPDEQNDGAVRFRCHRPVNVPMKEGASK